MYTTLPALSVQRNAALAGAAAKARARAANRVAVFMASRGSGANRESLAHAPVRRQCGGAGGRHFAPVAGCALRQPFLDWAKPAKIQRFSGIPSRPMVATGAAAPHFHVTRGLAPQGLGPSAVTIGN